MIPRNYFYWYDELDDHSDQMLDVIDPPEINDLPDDGWQIPTEPF